MLLQAEDGAFHRNSTRDWISWATDKCPPAWGLWEGEHRAVLTGRSLSLAHGAVWYKAPL